MKNKTICNIYEGLIQLSQDKDLKFSPKVAFYLAKNKAILEPLYKTIKQCEKDIWNQFGTIQDGNIIVDNEKVSNLTNALEELKNIDTEVILDVILLDELGENNISFEIMDKIWEIVKET